MSSCSRLELLSCHCKLWSHSLPPHTASDTSTILAWLIDEGYDVVAFMADVGQEEDFEVARSKAMKCGAKDFILEDMKREFITELIYPYVSAAATATTRSRAIH